MSSPKETSTSAAPAGAPGGPPVGGDGPEGGRAARVCMVLDRSGSMQAVTTSGEREDFGFTMWDLARHCGKVAAGSMRRGDTLSIVTYSGESEVVLAPTRYDRSSAKRTLKSVSDKLGRISASGCTNMSDALKTAFETMPREANDGEYCAVIFASDGEPTGDRQDPEVVARQLRKARPHVEMHTVSIGQGANHALMRSLAEACGGVFRFVSDGTMLGTTIVSTIANVLRGGGPGAHFEAFESEAMDMAAQELLDNANISDAAWAVRLRDRLRKAGKAHPNSEAVAALLHDVQEQVLLGLSTRENYAKWGRAYILSLGHSLRARQRSNFKDRTSALFSNDFVDHVDRVFNDLPAMKPSRATRASKPAPRSMRSYNCSHGVCFTGDCLVTMADGSRRPARDLRAGDRVRGGGTVARLLVTRLGQPVEVVAVRAGVKVTPYHPVRVPGGRWVFPEHVAGAARVQTRELYNVLLEKGSPETQRLDMSGVDVITLAHGVRDDPVATHEYFGTDAVRDWVMGLDADAAGHAVVHRQLVVVNRDPRTMKVTGIRAEAGAAAATSVSA